MKKLTLLALTLLLAVSLPAAEIDRAAAALAGTEASFSQSFTPKGFNKPQTESGTVVFGTLPMMRWSYTSPEEKLFVFDGARSWFYVPADKQVTVTTLDASRRAELPFLLVGDPAARDKNFVTSEKVQGGIVVSRLTPRSSSAMIRGITLDIDRNTHLIQRVAYTDREGNQTTFKLTFRRKRQEDAAFFRFTPPAGVQVVEQ